MGESKRLSLGATQIIKSMITEPDATWTTGRILDACNRSERVADQVIKVLLRSGAAVMEQTGSRLRYGYGRPRAAEEQYRLTSDAPAILRQALEDSWSSRGFVVTLLLEGWEPAKFSWQQRRHSRKTIATNERRGYSRERDPALFDPYEGRRFGRLYHWLDRLASRGRS